MDSTLYKAAMEGNMGDDDFILADHLRNDEENGYQVTVAKGNTVLHVAALYGQSHFAKEVLKISPGMLCHQNKKNETALHVATNEGHINVVRLLLSEAGDDKERVMRMIDENGDTALHKAVSRRLLCLVSILVKEDPEFEFPPNMAGETPLYMAADSGFHGALVEILESCNQPNSIAAGPDNRTPLLAAVIHKDTNSARLLWQMNKSLCEEPDKWGWNYLHYAVKQGLKELVSDMLGWKKSLAYLPAGSENDWTTIFHIAASEGDISMINELSKHCPDCWEMLNSRGQNVLHVAILNTQEKVVKSLLNSKRCHNLVDEPDNDGNTPLHLVAVSGIHVLALLRHPRAKKMPLNKENQTPLDIALTYQPTTHKEMLVKRHLHRIDRRFGRTNLKIERIDRTPKTKDDIMKKRENKAKEYATKRDELMKAIEVKLVVATLLVTLTFAAGFTLPGGFDSDPGPDKGMAILVRKVAFRAFVVSDAIAFTCSIGAVFTYLIMAGNTASKVKRKYEVLWTLSIIATYLLILAMLAVAIAFVSGTIATLANSPNLAITVCVISCLSFILYALVLYILRSS